MGALSDCNLGGASTTCSLDASPPFDVSVSSFAMDAYEVTIDRFRAFWYARSADEGASIRAHPIIYPGGQMIAWEGTGREPIASTAVSFCNWSASVASREQHPIVCVDWWTAQEFCVWDGGRLPTEAEWEYAARGRSALGGLISGRLYPWGNEAPSESCDRAQWNACPGEDGAITRRVGRFLPSGGLFDLAGNVKEWTADSFAPYAAPPCWDVGPLRHDPLCNAGPDSVRATRGGNAVSTMQALRAASRIRGRGTDLFSVGMRCVRSR